MGQSIAGVTSNNNFQMQNINGAMLSNPQSNFIYQGVANQSLIINQQQIQSSIVNPITANSAMIISGVNSQQRQYKQSVLGIASGVSQLIPPLQSQILQQNQNSPGINQTSLRFQLNTKRFSNAKEQPFSGQSQIQSHSQPHTSQYQPILQNTFQQPQSQNQPLSMQMSSQPAQSIQSQMRNHNNVRIVQKGNNQMMLNVSTNMQYQAGESIQNYNAQLISSNNQNSIQQHMNSNLQQTVYLKPTTSPTNLSKTMSQFPSQHINSLILSNNSNSTTNTTANQFQQQQHGNGNYKILQPASQKILLSNQNQNSQLQNYHQQQAPVLLQQNPSNNNIIHSSSNLHNQQINIAQNSSGLEYINDFNQQIIYNPQIENFIVNDQNFVNNIQSQHTKKVSLLGATNMSQNLNLMQQTSEHSQMMMNPDIQLKKHQLQSNMHPVKIMLNSQGNQQYQNKQNENRPQSQNNRIQSQPPQSSSITYSQPSNLINNKLNKATSFQLANNQNQINQTPQQETKVKLVFSQNNQLLQNQSSMQNPIRPQNIQQLQQSQTQNQFQQSIKNANAQQQFNISSNNTQQQIVLGKVQLGNPIQPQSLAANNAQQNKILSIKTIQLQQIKLANNGQNLGIAQQDANQGNALYQYNSQLGINQQQTQQNAISITQINQMQPNSQNGNQFTNSMIQQQNLNSQLNNLQQQKQLSLIRASTHQQNTIKFIKNQLSHISKLMEDETGDQQDSNHIEGSAPAVPPFHISKNHENAMSDKKNGSTLDGQYSQMYHQHHQNVNKMALGQMGHLIDQDDDQESMMSDQFNTSNESMFKVRGVSTIGGGINGGYILGGGLNAGDSTYRCNESAQEDDRGLISESEDGWYPDKDNVFRHEQQAHENFNDISEHSSDEQTDSDMDGDGANNNNKDNITQIKKIKKNKGEKGEKKKKKKKKGQDQQQMPIEQYEPPVINMQQAIESKKIFQTYKILQDNENDKKKVVKQVSQDTKIQQKQGNTGGNGLKDEKKVFKNNATGKDSLKDSSIKVNIQVKKNEKQNENQSTLNAQNQNKNQFNSPNIKIGKIEKLQQTNIKQSQTVNQTSKKEQNYNDKNINQPQKTKNDDFTRAIQNLELQKMPSSSTNTNSIQGQLQQNAATPLKKPKKNTFKLQALNHALPKNLQECYDRFFESGFKINPQFEYENNQSAQKFLEQFVEPDGQYLEISKRILDSFLKEYGSETNYLAKEGKILNQDETHQYIIDYLQNLGVEEWIQINFQKNQVAPTSVTHDPKTGKCKMNIKLPCEYREGRMIGVLDHEIGTHFLRKHNEKMQQWYKKREKFDMKTCIATEEGFACTNQMIQTVKEGNCKPFMYRSALNYYAAFMAKELSFVELFKALERYVETPQSRWKFCLRVKRGLTDTSMKGGLYKDQVYLEGAIKVLQQRQTLNFKGLLCGKISLEDINREQISSILNYEGQLLPMFMEDMDEYMRSLDIIAQCNHIDDTESININYLPIAYNNQEDKGDDHFEQIDEDENPSEQSADENNTNNNQFMSNADLQVKSEEITPNQRNLYQENPDFQNAYDTPEHINAI